MKMGNISVHPGESLAEVAIKMQKSLRSNGHAWRIVVDCEAAQTQARNHFGSGGTALTIPIIAKKFGCKCHITTKEKLFLLLPE
jgi:hypothetical protein